MLKEEKRVLWRKKFTIASQVTLTEEFLVDLLDAELITPQGREQVKVENSNVARVDRWMDVIQHIDNKNVYNDLCKFLDRHNTLLGDDLRIELKAEKAGNAMKIEEWIRREAEALVQRDFGNSRRLSEFDKRDIRVLVESRMQMMQDLWTAQRQRKSGILEDEIATKLTYRENATEMVKKINSFLRVNKKALKSNVSFDDETKGVKPKRTPSFEDKNLVTQMNSTIQSLIDVSNQCIMELEHLKQERGRTLQVIKVKDKTRAMDEEIIKILDMKENAMEELKHKVINMEDAILKLENNLDKNIRKASQDDCSHEKEVQKLYCQLQVSNEKIVELEETVRRKSHEMLGTREALDKHRNKSEMLEKSRRLGFKPVDKPKNKKK